MARRSAPILCQDRGTIRCRNTWVSRPGGLEVACGRSHRAFSLLTASWAIFGLWLQPNALLSKCKFVAENYHDTICDIVLFAGFSPASQDALWRDEPLCSSLIGRQPFSCQQPLMTAAVWPLVALSNHFLHNRHAPRRALRGGSLTPLYLSFELVSKRRWFCSGLISAVSGVQNTAATQWFRDFWPPTSIGKK